MRKLKETSEPVTIHLPSQKISRLLKWILHSLEIFCWEQDYCTGFDQEEKAPWSVLIQYHDGHEQRIDGRGGWIPDRVEELYFAFAEYFEDIVNEDDDDYDFLKEAYDCQDLLALSDLTSMLLQCARDGNEIPLALAWTDLLTRQVEIRQLDGKRTYQIHSGAAACINFMLSFVLTGTQDQVGRNFTGTERLEEFVRFVHENILPPAGPLISVAEIETTLSAIENKYRPLQSLFREQKLKILRLDNTHTAFNSICNTVHHLKDNSVFEYNLFLFHTRGAEAGHPVYIFLHELGHIFQVELTHDPERVPDSFLDFLQHGGIEMAQGPQLVELFADTFAMAMMCSFEWSDYDPFCSIPDTAKNYMRLYMEAIIRKLDKTD